MLELLRFELQDVVRVQISAKPYQNNCREGDEAGTVLYDRKKGKQKNPEGGIIGHPDQGEWVSGRLFDGNVVSRDFPKPREPHGCVAFDNQSVKRADDRKPDQATPP